MLIAPLNTPGRHCASSGLRNLAAFHGLGWTEAMCFGLGAGLGIWYIKSKKPSRMIHVRSADIEEQFFLRIGQPLPWDRFDSPDASEKALASALDSGVPAIVQTDIYYLPYYQSSTHFPGHVITVWGYDPERRVFKVTDTERPDLIDVAFDDMKKARYCNDGFFDVKGNCMAPQSMGHPENLAACIRQAIAANSRVILDRGWPFQGMVALEAFLKELPQWSAFEDWQWAARFAYQVIEKRGTGGGGFRLMYADFLDEGASLVPEVEHLGLPAMMRQSAAAWTALAYAFKDASERDAPDFGEAEKRLEAVLAAETLYHQQALEMPLQP